jgi:hypothetical protein
VPFAHIPGMGQEIYWEEQIKNEKSFKE